MRPIGGKCLPVRLSAIIGQKYAFFLEKHQFEKKKWREVIDFVFFQTIYSINDIYEDVSQEGE